MVEGSSLLVHEVHVLVQGLEECVLFHEVSDELGAMTCLRCIIRLFLDFFFVEKKNAKKICVPSGSRRRSSACRLTSRTCPIPIRWDEFN